jgi:hypothetical protein
MVILRRMLDSSLLDAIDALTGVTHHGEVWRVTWATRDPLTGGVAGGRWSPPDDFEVLYTSLAADGALAEAYCHLSRAPVFSSSAMTVNKLAIDLTDILIFNIDTLQRLGVEDPLANRVDYSITQSIGEAVHMLDYEGFIIPSARYDCSNLVLFMDRIDLNAQLRFESAEDINWPAWKERHKTGRASLIT